MSENWREAGTRRWSSRGGGGLGGGRYWFPGTPRGSLRRQLSSAALTRGWRVWNSGADSSATQFEDAGGTPGRRCSSGSLRARDARGSVPRRPEPLLSAQPGPERAPPLRSGPAVMPMLCRGRGYPFTYTPQESRNCSFCDSPEVTHLGAVSPSPAPISGA